MREKAVATLAGRAGGSGGEEGVQAIVPATTTNRYFTYTQRLQRMGTWKPWPG